MTDFPYSQPAPFWVLELFTRGGGPSFGRYFAGFSLAEVNSANHGTADIHAAKQYPSKADAEAAAERLNQRLNTVKWQAIEHGWVAAQPAEDEWPLPSAEELRDEQRIAWHDNGIRDARKGVQEVGTDPDDETLPDGWSAKTFCRIEFGGDDGDASVGQPGWAGWVLAADQTGTVIADLAKFPAPEGGELTPEQNESALATALQVANKNGVQSYTALKIIAAYQADVAAAQPQPKGTVEAYEYDPEHTPEDNETFSLLHAFEMYCRGQGHAWAKDRLVAHLWARFAAAVQAPAVGPQILAEQVKAEELADIAALRERREAEPVVWTPLPFKTPLELWKAFKAGTKLVLHYYDKQHPVERMEARSAVVYVQPPGMAVKVFPDGSSAEGNNPGQGIWLRLETAVSQPPVQDTAP